MEKPLRLRGGGQMNSFSIKCPHNLPDMDFDKIILATHTGYDEIMAQLQSLKIPSDKIDANLAMSQFYARKNFLYSFSQIAKECNLLGSVAEVGVYRGDFAQYINAFFPEKTLYLMDTFEGFAQQDIVSDSMSAELGAGHFANTSVELVYSKMPHKHNCVIKQGWFPETAAGLEEEEFCFVSLDTDLYAPILSGLEFFYPRLVKGGAILVDDYFSKGYDGVKKAVDLFCARENIVFTPIGDLMGVAIRKVS